VPHYHEVDYTGEADKRNFRKMALESKLLKEKNAFERGSHRPARLYEAKSLAKNRRTSARCANPKKQ
jgi:hypothetical protein